MKIKTNNKKKKPQSAKLSDTHQQRSVRDDDCVTMTLFSGAGLHIIIEQNRLLNPPRGSCVPGQPVRTHFLFCLTSG